jgi:hypothetical protein
MTDSEWILDPVDRMFDAQLEAFEFREKNGSTSYLEVGEPGVQFLLGRNGSGKSTLMRGIGNLWGESHRELGLESRLLRLSDPGLEVSAIYRLPGAELLERWALCLDESLSEEWMDAFEESQGFYPLSHGTALNEVFDLPVLRLFITSCAEMSRGELMSTLPAVIRRELPGDTLGDMLRWFGFSEQAIDDWNYLSNLGDGALPSIFRWDADVARGYIRTRVEEGPPKSFMIQRCSVAIFLNLIRNADVAIGDDDADWTEYGIRRFARLEGLVGSTNSRPWLRNAEFAGLIGPALEQFLATCDRVVARSTGCAQLVAPVPASGPLREFFDVCDRRHAESPPEGSVRLTFPHTLFYRTDLADEPCVMCDEFKIEPIMVGDQQNFVPFSTTVLEGDDRSTLDRLVHASADHFEAWARSKAFISAMSSSEGDGEVPVDDHALRMSEYFSAIGSDLHACEIGIAGVRVVETPSTRERSDEHERRWMIEWQSPFSDRWLKVDSMSQGQRDALTLLLAIGPTRGEGPYAPYRSLDTKSASWGHSASFVLADEFDKHLHPTASRLLAERIHATALQSGARVILSTHSVPALTDRSLRQARRIFASRTVEGGFSYSTGQEVDRSVLAEVLGVDHLDALRLTNGFLLVEGMHEEALVARLMSDPMLGPPVEGVDVINARGIWSYSGIWSNVLRLLEARVVVMYDKQSVVFEDEWRKFQNKLRAEDSVHPAWRDTGFASMLEDVQARRREHKSQSGDDELANILGFAKSVILDDSGRLGPVVQRIDFLGLQCHDIVDLLPVSAFPPAIAVGRTWDEVRTWWNQHPRADRRSTDFKKHFGINERSVKTAVARIDLSDPHPEILRIAEAIRLLAGGTTSAR